LLELLDPRLGFGLPEVNELGADAPLAIIALFPAPPKALKTPATTTLNVVLLEKIEIILVGPRIRLGGPG
jgi:hypothetical protein